LPIATARSAGLSSPPGSRLKAAPRAASTLGAECDLAADRYGRRCRFSAPWCWPGKNSRSSAGAIGFSGADHGAVADTDGVRCGQREDPALRGPAAGLLCGLNLFRARWRRPWRSVHECPGTRSDCAPAEPRAVCLRDFAALQDPECVPPEFQRSSPATLKPGSAAENTRRRAASTAWIASATIGVGAFEVSVEPSIRLGVPARLRCRAGPLPILAETIRHHLQNQPAVSKEGAHPVGMGKSTRAKAGRMPVVPQNEPDPDRATSVRAQCEINRSSAAMAAAEPEDDPRACVRFARCIHGCAVMGIRTVRVENSSTDVMPDNIGPPRRAVSERSGRLWSVRSTRPDSPALPFENLASANMVLVFTQRSCPRATFPETRDGSGDRLCGMNAPTRIGGISVRFPSGFSFSGSIRPPR